MTASILALLCAIVPFGIFLWQRRIQQADSPAFQARERHEAIAKEIFDRSPARINDSLNSDLDRVRSLSRDKRGPGGSASDGR